MSIQPPSTDSVFWNDRLIGKNPTLQRAELDRFLKVSGITLKRGLAWVRYSKLSTLVFLQAMQFYC